MNKLFLLVLFFSQTELLFAIDDDIFYDALDVPYKSLKKGDKDKLRKKWMIEEKLFYTDQRGQSLSEEIKSKRKIAKITAEFYLKKAAKKFKKFFKRIPKGVLEKIAEGGGDMATTYTLSVITEKVLTGDLIKNIKGNTPPADPTVMGDVAAKFVDSCRVAAADYWTELPETINGMAKEKKITQDVKENALKTIDAINNFRETLNRGKEYYESTTAVYDEQGKLIETISLLPESIDNFVRGKLFRYFELARSFGGVCYSTYNTYKTIEKQTL